MLVRFFRSGPALQTTGDDMLFTLLLTCLPLTPPAPPVAAPPIPLIQDPVEEPEDEGPTEDEIEAMVARIEAAFKPKVEIADKLDAIQAAADVPADDVAKALRDGLDDDEHEVVNATLGVLAKMPVEKALDELLRFHKKDRRLKKDDELLANSFKAIAWHGDADTVELFTDKVFHNTSKQVLQARIYGLGLIRAPEAVEGLIDVMKAGNVKKGNQNPYMAEIELALTVLVGETDCGKNQAKWIAWWNDHKRDLEVPVEPPELNKNMQRQWNNYWGIKADREKGDGSR